MKNSTISTKYLFNAIQFTSKRDYLLFTIIYPFKKYKEEKISVIFVYLSVSF